LAACFIGYILSTCQAGHGKLTIPMRHTLATHALARGAELTSVRDNLRHASIANTSIYLHGNDLKRAMQIGSAFLARE